MVSSSALIYVCVENAALYWLVAYMFHYMGWESKPTERERCRIPNVLCNQLVITPLLMLSLERFHFIPWETELTLWLVPQLLIGILYLSILGYGIHYALHTKFLYLSIHRIHHRWMSTKSWTALDTHPLEHIALDMFPALITPTVFSWGIHLYRAWFAFLIINSLLAHRTHIMDHGNHQNHHLHQEYNFGKGPLNMDHLLGTDWQPKVRDQE